MVAAGTVRERTAVLELVTCEGRAGFEIKWSSRATGQNVEAGPQCLCHLAARTFIDPKRRRNFRPFCASNEQGLVTSRCLVATLHQDQQTFGRRR